MSRLRTVLVACLTFAVATLPAAGAFAPAAMADASPDTAGMHCAEHAKATQAGQEQQSQPSKIDRAEPGRTFGHCADHAACGGKCLCVGLTAVLAVTPDIRAARLPRPAATRVAAHLSGPAYIPPSPPPRV